YPEWQLKPNSYRAKTLKVELAQSGRFPYDECLRIGLRLTSALAHLHQVELLHRDIKPENIIFVDGAAKLADIRLLTNFTEANSFVGKKGYIPPEGPGTTPADIYALGKVLYQIWTGKSLLKFPETPHDLQEMIERTRLLKFNKVVKKACEKQVDARYQNG